ERSARFVPHASVVAGDDAETVGAWTEIVVERLATLASFLPVRILSFELVAKPHFPRELETERGVVDFELSPERWKTCGGDGRVVLPVRDDRFDPHRRRHSVHVGVPGVEHLHERRAGEP